MGADGGGPAAVFGSGLAARKGLAWRHLELGGAATIGSDCRDLIVEGEDCDTNARFMFVGIWRKSQLRKCKLHSPSDFRDLRQWRLSVSLGIEGEGASLPSPRLLLVELYNKVAIEYPVS